MAKKKFYVVWKGRQTGIFETWGECKEQIFEYPKAVYKSFLSRELAEKAFRGNSDEFLGQTFFETELSPEQIAIIGELIPDSIAVDRACNGATGEAEYQGVHVESGKTIFKVGPFEDGTNNLVEFLALVHALAYCKQKELNLPVYSDSITAISWVREKKINTQKERSEKNQKIFNLLERALKWLSENEYNNKILKWETKAWGENPADFKRK